jgi:hypothetical protein
MRMAVLDRAEGVSDSAEQRSTEGRIEEGQSRFKGLMSITLVHLSTWVGLIFPMTDRIDRVGRASRSDSSDRPSACI